jgi:prepilin-type N-terminal cleavage/methylation domain-containing protein
MLGRSGLQSTRASHGFTLIELLVVIAISLVVAVFAIPTISVTLDSFELRGSMNGAVNLAQKCRMQAIKSDLTERMHFANNATQVVLFVADSTDVNVLPKPGDAQLHAQLWLPIDFTTPGLPTGGPTQLTPQTMWGSNLAPNINVDAYFNSRGLPCLPVANGSCQPTTGFVYYFKFKNGLRTRWSAISVSPAGRVETWIWNGTFWEN